MSDARKIDIAACELVVSTSESNFKKNRAAWERRKAGAPGHLFTSGSVSLSWARFFELADALEAEYPGWIDRTFAVLAERD